MRAEHRTKVQTQMAQAIPAEKLKRKKSRSFQGILFIAAGLAFMGGDIWLLIRVQPFTPWLLVPFGAGFVFALYGSHIVSAELSEASGKWVAAWMKDMAASVLPFKGRK